MPIFWMNSYMVRSLDNQFENNDLLLEEAFSNKTKIIAIDMANAIQDTSPSTLNLFFGYGFTFLVIRFPSLLIIKNYSFIIKNDYSMFDMITYCLT